MVQEIKTYKTYDGQIFNDKKTAEQHEEYLRKNQCVKSFSEYLQKDENNKV